MAKKAGKKPDTRAYEKRCDRIIAKQQSEIDKAYDKACKEAARLATMAGGELPDEKAFSFADLPNKKDVAKLTKALRKQLEVAVIDGVKGAWTLANNKNNELSNVVFGDNVARLTKQQYKHYYNNNDDALDAFLARKDAGMGLSDRVWNYTDNFMELAEKGIEYGIRTGADAPTMARDLKDYLKFPDKLFRRVRGADGELHLSKAAQEFHPGQGVYRSSYANAMRLARTEINMAYRTADYERYQQLDFVVGFKVVLSNNHTCKGVKGIFVDICDELQGEYPKDFKFVGWHPHCRCHVEAILSTEDEIKQNLKDILQGKETELQSVNEVKELPENFTNWLENNAERIKNAKNMPYFIYNNTDHINLNTESPERQNVDRTQENAKEEIKAHVEPVIQAKEVIQETFEEVAQQWELRQGVTEEKFNSCDMAQQFGLNEFKSQVTDVLSHHGVNVNRAWVNVKSEYFSFTMRGEGFELTRTFGRSNGEIECHHSYFKLDEDLQGKGIAKDIFKIALEHYKRIGVDKITLDANKDIGGYAWARYGFQAETMRDALSACNHGSQEVRQTAMDFVKKWYKDNSFDTDHPFPMRLLTEQPWGKDVIMGSYWSGVLNLKDQEQLSTLMSYLYDDK